MSVYLLQDNFSRLFRDNEFMEGDYCHSTDNVNKCIDAVNTISCEDIAGEGYLLLTGCSALFIEMVDYCSEYKQSKADNEEDDDDDDWD